MKPGGGGILTEQQLWFFGTAGTVGATIGAFSILIYMFWYDKLTSRFEAMINEIKMLDLGRAMEAHGARRLLIAVASPLFRWKKWIDIEEDTSLSEEMVADALKKFPEGTQMRADESRIRTQRITTGAYDLLGSIRRRARRILLSILLLGAGVSITSLIAFMHAASVNGSAWQWGVLAAFLALWVLLLFFVALFIVEPYPFWNYFWFDFDKGVGGSVGSALS